MYLSMHHPLRGQSHIVCKHAHLALLTIAAQLDGATPYDTCNHHMADVFADLRANWTTIRYHCHHTAARS